jgi:hypothetical protein
MLKHLLNDKPLNFPIPQKGRIFIHSKPLHFQLTLEGPT